MDFNRPLYKANAKRALKNCFLTAMVACIIVTVLSGALTSFSTFRQVIGGSGFLPSLARPAVTDGGDQTSLSEADIPEELTDPDADPAELAQYGLASSDGSASPAPAATVRTGGVNAPIALLFTILVANIIEIGSAYFFIRVREGEAEINNIFRGFRDNYGGKVGVMFIRDIFIALWSLLLVVPGVIKWYQYSMVPYVLAEDPRMSYKEAFRVSTKMTNGHKWDLFVLDLSFIGWYLLCIVTLGLGTLFLNPYIGATRAEAYAALKEAAAAADAPAIPAAEPEAEPEAEEPAEGSEAEAE